ncbi:hypothetical protein QUH71_01360 [Priestia aryabhattai]|uniref:hypothetical protein n=1 Tax=Priestia aryabhattai TaxID=412384 RepID=UPI0025A48E23|nr:hypothetical protein [Priestia aryabhattai]WJN45178.1 hypothetical protein QUH71_01360 [Priestia aryabhattai]
METCTQCNKEIADDEVVKTDEFKEYGAEVKNYCPECFLEGVKHGFGNYEIGICSVCQSPLVLQTDEEGTIHNAQFDMTVHYTCEKVKAAEEKGDETEIERLESEDHDWLILYTIEPDPDLN